MLEEVTILAHNARLEFGSSPQGTTFKMGFAQSKAEDSEKAEADFTNITHYEQILF